MTDDFSEVIDNAECYNVNSESTLYAYRSRNRYSYAKVGNKWWLRQTDTYTTIGNNINCYSYDDISSINSYPEFEPIFVFIALLLVGFVIFLWFNIFKRITVWKI